MASAPPLKLVVVVPARDEASSLPQCLASLRVARSRLKVPVCVVVVLDDCVDGTRVADGDADLVVELKARCVGAARAAGFDSVDTNDAWLVCTDADCTVDPGWLRRHYDYAASGARVVCGTVTVRDWSDLGAEARAEYEAGYTHGAGHGHVHGANLGFRASDYRAIGGFSSLQTGEDVDLVRRLEDRGVPITWAGDIPVLTSARTNGRAPDGFADHLRELQDNDEAGELTAEAS